MNSIYGIILDKEYDKDIMRNSHYKLVMDYSVNYFNYVKNYSKERNEIRKTINQLGKAKSVELLFDIINNTIEEYEKVLYSTNCK